MYTLVYALCAAAQLALAVIAIRLYRRRPSLGALTLILPIAGVVWDNAVVALGTSIGEGALLTALTWPRFVGHALLTPIWIITAVAFGQRAGIAWLHTRAVAIGQWVLYALCVIAGLLRSVIFANMTLATDHGLLYYRNTGSFGPPVGSIIMLLVVLVIGIMVWQRAHTFWMTLGALFMLAMTAIPIHLVGFIASNSGEVIMAASLVATEHILQTRARLAGTLASGQ
ncbi:MAG: hypothetical protein LBB54_04345 [Cellulomonadaceae bacterium]|jgi:hypothetical protein|nr:hypothetical protein [Cellulomonadaceae bacterium]